MKLLLKLKALNVSRAILRDNYRSILFLKNTKFYFSNTTSELITKSIENGQNILTTKEVYNNIDDHIIYKENKIKRNEEKEIKEKEIEDPFSDTYVKDNKVIKEIDNFDRKGKQRNREIENGFFNRKQNWLKSENEKYKKNATDEWDYKKRRYTKRFDESDEINDEKNQNFSNRHHFGKERDRYNNLGENLKTIDWNKTEVQIERENLYDNEEYDKKLKKLSSEELQEELKKNDIHVNQNLSINHFITNFSDINFEESIINYLNSKYQEPTAIQKITWPIALSGKDLIGIAETGSGKTLAYVLPALMHILRKKEKGKKELKTGRNEEDDNNTKDILEDVDAKDVYALVVLPTRELCVQVVNEIKIFEKMLNIKSTAIYGGVPKHYQINNLKSGADVIVCTPGRLLDFLESGLIHLLKCIYVVIDEADRLLDMGFEKQLRKIMSQINKNKQLLFLTATWPEQVKKLAYDFCSHNPIKVQIGKSELTANKNIEQNVLVCSSIDMKKKLLEWLKENYENNKILIFCATKRNCDNLCKELRYHQFNALSIHGDKQQRERDRILNNFKTDKCNILVATDVASRGLDIKNISVVINFDIPNTIEDYIHRIGRTGRAGNKGKSLLFFSYDYYVPQKMKFAKELIKLLNKTNQYVSNELKEIAYSR